ncbi:ankyrin [Karstenula rhodostoma CBS 690.94]|uniref:Ankyrin n=1 Tax=Karstenula rhodostoma CBS 690.94 TaxID=1392251 RepID=A0A9P4PBX0_9PLEO|nr:ankyrin [Karstenula rhodostoma CBS 690.94]
MFRLRFEEGASTWFGKHHLFGTSGSELNRQDGFGWQPLHYAVASSHANIVSMLLEFGAPANALDKDGRTPLHLAARHGNQAVVQLLLDAGACAEVKDAMDVTPLRLAAQPGHLEITKALPKAEADMSTSLPDGNDALSLALGAGSCSHDQGSGNSSTESDTGTPAETRTRLPTSQGLKREKPPRDGGRNPEEDDTKNHKQLCARENSGGFACPFQKRFLANTSAHLLRKFPV